MRRLVIELYGKELERRIERSPYQKIRSMELVRLLRNDNSENVAIWKMELKDPSSKLEDCFKEDRFTKDVQVLERKEAQDGEGSSYIVFLRRKVRPGLLLGYGNKPGGGYMLGPLRISDGRLTFTFIGTQKQIKSIFEGAEKRRLKYRVMSLTDADFAEDSLLNRLTEKQRKVLLLAFKLGYFDVPKKINSDELATRLRLTGSTVVEHLNKAEHRLLTGIIIEN
jgi:hypothetical protein